METKSSLKNFESENYSEIKSANVLVGDLKKWGINDKILASELYLYKIYGDEILQNNIDDSFDTTKKKEIKHLDENEKKENVNLFGLYQDIDDSKFDEELELLLSKMGE